MANPSSTLIVGDTGTGKSELLGTLAEHDYDKFGILSYLYVSDPGGWGDNLQSLIDLGIVRVFKLYTRDPESTLGLAFETAALCTKGYWPAEFIDPLRGEVPTGVAMVPPVQTTFLIYCASGHLAYQGPPTGSDVTAFTCPECPPDAFVMLSDPAVTLKKVTVPTPGFPERRNVFFDGLSSMQSTIMRDMAARAGRRELGGEEAALGGRIVSGSLILGGSNRSHYGFAQIRAEEWPINSLGIPFLFRPPVWTALEQKATDRDTKLPIYGPQIAGNAKTADVPTWFGNCLGTQVVKNAKKQSEWRLYLREFALDDGIAHLCKTRVSPGLLPEYLVDDPGEPLKKFNLGHFYSLLDAALASTKAAKEEKFAGRLPAAPQKFLQPTTPASGPSAPLPQPTGGGGAAVGVVAQPQPQPQPQAQSPAAPLPPSAAPAVPIMRPRSRR